MKFTWMTPLTLAALLGLAAFAAGCGDDDGHGHDEDAGTDSGPLDIDAGPEEDAGPEDIDAGPPDAGPPAMVNVRLAHLMPNQGAIRLCIDTIVGGMTLRTDLLPTTMQYPMGIPLRGVSAYINTFPPGLDYTINVYDAAEIDAWNMATMGDERCPNSMDKGAPEPVLTTMIAPTDLVAGNDYTIAFVGFLQDEDMTPADNCGMPPTFEGVECPAALNAKMMIIEDDNTAPMMDMVRIRLLQGVPDLPPLDVCYDADGPGGAAPELLFDNVEFVGGGMTPPYVERAPITGGTFTFHLNNPMVMENCSPLTALSAMPTPVPWPGTCLMTSPGTTSTFDANDVVTLFGSGNAGGPPPPAGNGAAFVPFVDRDTDPEVCP